MSTAASSTSLSGRTKFFLDTIQDAIQKWKYEPDNRQNARCVEDRVRLDAYIMPLLKELKLAVCKGNPSAPSITDKKQKLAYTVQWFKVPTPILRISGGYLIPLKITPDTKPRYFPPGDTLVEGRLVDLSPHNPLPEGHHVDSSEEIYASPDFICVIALPMPDKEMTNV